MIDAMIGRVLGQHELVERLGHGGMGLVYRGVHRVLETPRAVKVLASNLAADEEFVRRFEREARVASQLRHPNIVLLHDVGSQDGVYFLVMELLEGMTLRQLIRTGGAQPFDRALNLLRQLGAALDFAHGRGVLHRDVKPENVFVGPDDHLTLVDFGLARAAEGTMVTASRLMGTPEYMAPEILEGSTATRSADLYALGVVAYELLTGRMPFAGSNTPSVMNQVLHHAPPRPRSLRPDLPTGAEAVLLHQIEKDPSRRFASSAAFLNALEQALRLPDAPATPEPAREQEHTAVVTPPPPEPKQESEASERPIQSQPVPSQPIPSDVSSLPRSSAEAWKLREEEAARLAREKAEEWKRREEEAARKAREEAAEWKRRQEEALRKAKAEQEEEKAREAVAKLEYEQTVRPDSRPLPDPLSTERSPAPAPVPEPAQRVQPRGSLGETAILVEEPRPERAQDRLTPAPVQHAGQQTGLAVLLGVLDGLLLSTMLYLTVSGTIYPETWAARLDLPYDFNWAVYPLLAMTLSWVYGLPLLLSRWRHLEPGLGAGSIARFWGINAALLLIVGLGMVLYVTQRELGPFYREDASVLSTLMLFAAMMLPLVRLGLALLLGAPASEGPGGAGSLPRVVIGLGVADGLLGTAIVGMIGVGGFYGQDGYALRGSRGTLVPLGALVALVYGIWILATGSRGARLAATTGPEGRRLALFSVLSATLALFAGIYALVVYRNRELISDLPFIGWMLTLAVLPGVFGPLIRLSLATLLARRLHPMSRAREARSARAASTPDQPQSASGFLERLALLSIGDGLFYVVTLFAGGISSVLVDWMRVSFLSLPRGVWVCWLVGFTIFCWYGLRVLAGGGRAPLLARLRGGPVGLLVLVNAVVMGISGAVMSLVVGVLLASAPGPGILQDLAKFVLLPCAIAALLRTGFVVWVARRRSEER